MANENYGNLMFFRGRKRELKETLDPYKGYKVVPRLGKNDCPEITRFEVPDDKYSLKLSQCMFGCNFKMPSNYVPDNDILSKGIKKWTLSLQILGSFRLLTQPSMATIATAKKIKRVIEKFNSELDPYSDDEVNIKATDIKTTAANGTDLKWWRPHDIIEDMVKTEEIEGQENFAEDEKMIYFFRENKLDPKERLKPRNF
ncbi:Oidioi.mRNA.OKI2018_I69.chr1.g1126.t1.cds [Oikopleura dioica]|uniref:Oidioi.mRNA.OKI2018_I69.chr1.g1126.t1.cds n=1 Tax=Oikopleura dioica TaxID=34765 RepID=A0ABN7SS60_OIKDI|nr:Oidioi.mRNA.OKI2018_I69.chr1.g1126.t1.cds [Oikopleura dioica]